MTDHSELKRLAEAFPDNLDFDSNTEPFFNGPSGESLGGGSTGFYSVYGKPFFIEGDDYEYDGPTYVESCNVDFAKFMVSAREGVLELIAEIDRLKAENELLATQARLAGVSAEVTVHQEVGRAITETLAVTIERDQLKTENERYLSLLDRMVNQYVPLTDLGCAPGFSRVVELVEVVAERDTLKAEVETLTAAAQALRDEWRKDQVEVVALRRAMHELANHPKLTASQVDILRAVMSKQEKQ